MGNLAGVAIAVVVTVDEAVMNGGNGVGHEVILEHRDDVGRADGQRSDVLHVGNNLVGEVGLHALDAGHVETVDIGTIAVDIGSIAVDIGRIAVDIGSIAVDIGKAVDIGIAIEIGIAVDIGIAVSIANMAGHGAASAAESNQDGLHVVFG